MLASGFGLSLSLFLSPLSFFLLLTSSCILQYILVFDIKFLSFSLLLFLPLPLSPFLRDSWEGLSGSILCLCFRLAGGFLTVSSQSLHKSKGYILSLNYYAEGFAVDSHFCNAEFVEAYFQMRVLL